jgi:hypothetical protein
MELGRVLVVLSDGGELIGHLQLIPPASGEVVEIKNLAVRRSFRRMGCRHDTAVRIAA